MKVLETFLLVTQRYILHFLHIVTGRASQPGYLHRGPLIAVISKWSKPSRRTSLKGMTVFGPPCLIFSSFSFSILGRPCSFLEAWTPHFVNVFASSALNSYRDFTVTPVDSQSRLYCAQHFGAIVLTN